MIKIQRLDSGYYLIRGDGPCEFAQIPKWPCSEETLRDSAFPEASESFIHAVIEAMEIHEEHSANGGGGK